MYLYLPLPVREDVLDYDLHSPITNKISYSFLASLPRAGVTTAGQVGHGQGAAPPEAARHLAGPKPGVTGARRKGKERKRARKVA